MIVAEAKVDIDALRHSSQVIVDDAHDWGYQLRFVNEAEYCGKMLVLTNGTSGSLHYHEKKKESFVVLHGVVWVGWKDGTGIMLYRGDSVTIPRRRAHRMARQCSDPSIILEVSTHDDDNDTYRVD